MDLNQEIFRVIIRALNPVNLPETSRLKIIEAVHFFEDTFKSNFFKSSIINFGGSTMGFNKKYNLGLTNEQIYFKLLTANETDGNMAPHIADLFLDVLSVPSDGRTIGFVRNNSNIICTYNEFLLTLDVATIAGHFAHEWTHLIGFSHPIDTGLNLAYLKKTVPYAVMNIVIDYVNQKKEDFLLV